MCLLTTKILLFCVANVAQSCFSLFFLKSFFLSFSFQEVFFFFFFYRRFSRSIISALSWRVLRLFQRLRSMCSDFILLLLFFYLFIFFLARSSENMKIKTESAGKNCCFHVSQKLNMWVQWQRKSYMYVRNVTFRNINNVATALLAPSGITRLPGFLWPGIRENPAGFFFFFFFFLSQRAFQGKTSERSFVQNSEAVLVEIVGISGADPGFWSWGGVLSPELKFAQNGFFL